MNIAALTQYLVSVENDRSLFDEGRFDRRADVIDELDFFLSGGEDHPSSTSPGSDDRSMELKERAHRLKVSLEEVDNKLFARLRGEIAGGRHRGPAFKELAGKYLGPAFFSCFNHNPDYDNLDIFINRLFPFERIPEPAATPEPEMVFYQKTPARIVFNLVDSYHFKTGDVFVDIGSGLGQAVILVNLLAQIKAIGIEIDPAFCSYAEGCAAQLNLTSVVFINADARQADYSQGTVFFMFTPFRGAMMNEVLERLRKESLSRRITLITYGPCTTDVARQSWLKSDTPVTGEIYRPAVFTSF